MMKRFISCVLIGVFIFSLTALSVNADNKNSFPDLSSTHWSYSSVMALVEDGTVSGFVDGEFKPDNIVSRAEFVKMLGKGSERSEKEYNDVDLSHWGYEYIMFSGLESVNNEFMPDTAISRYDVINLIWKRNGSKKDIIAPSIITSQGANKDAVAWGYTYGVMVGDDGINLRLNDALSRAEAAVLIMRARGISDSSVANNFVETVSPKTLEILFDSFKLFDDIVYEKDKTITYGEMARAAVRLGSEEFNPSYKTYTVDSTFDHKYAKDLHAIGNESIGKDKISLDLIDKPANVQDTLIALTYAMIRKSHNGVRYGTTGNYYKDILNVDSNIKNICLTYSYENGVQLYADGTIKPEKTITLKELTSILLQLDYLIGAYSETTTDYVNKSQVINNSKIRKTINSYPTNYNDYQFILEQLPNVVYETPFADNINNNIPITSYNFARDFGFIFTNMLGEMKKFCENATDVKIRFTYYPSLVCENGNGATLRVKCEIMDNPNNLTLNEIFNSKIEVSELIDASKGTIFYVDIVTGQPLTDIYMPINLSVLKQIVHVVIN